MTELEQITAIDCMAEEILHHMRKQGLTMAATEDKLRTGAQFYWSRKMESLTEEAWDGFAFIEQIYDTALERFLERKERSEALDV